MKTYIYEFGELSDEDKTLHIMIMLWNADRGDPDGFISSNLEKQFRTACEDKDGSFFKKLATLVESGITQNMRKEIAGLIFEAKESNPAFKPTRKQLKTMIEKELGHTVGKTFVKTAAKLACYKFPPPGRPKKNGRDN